MKTGSSINTCTQSLTNRY